ncbi:MAG: hypothetical protein IJ266_03410, partial [Elusimicrobiaceae bacterium]|nr:hypothetical protein [Elusimicrobiaceae bacterium]
ALLKAITGWDTTPFAKTQALVHALETVLPSAQFSAVREAAKRVCNILKKAPKVSTQVDVNLFETQAERALYDTLQQAPTCSATTAPQFAQALQAMERFQAPLEAFFTDVMVNVPDEKLRNNRLALLGQVRHYLTQTVADISAL